MQITYFFKDGTKKITKPANIVNFNVSNDVAIEFCHSLLNDKKKVNDCISIELFTSGKTRILYRKKVYCESKQGFTKSQKLLKVKEMKKSLTNKRFSVSTKPNPFTGIMTSRILK